MSGNIWTDTDPQDQGETFENEVETYTFRGFHIPGYMMGGLKRYIENHIPPGDFLTAIICNDLFEAVGRADDVNAANIPAYVGYFYNEAPSACWGSKEKMKAWVE